MIMCNVCIVYYMRLFVGCMAVCIARWNRHGKMPVSELMATEKFMNSGCSSLPFPSFAQRWLTLSLARSLKIEWNLAWESILFRIADLNSKPKIDFILQIKKEPNECSIKILFTFETSLLSFHVCSRFLCVFFPPLLIFAHTIYSVVNLCICSCKMEMKAICMCFWNICVQISVFVDRVASR